MNKIIQSQLEKVSVADLTNYDKTTNTFTIPKYNQIKVEEGSYYIIKLHPSLLNSNENTLLVTNWNCGSVPSHEYYKAEIDKVLGKMIKITGVGYDLVSNTDFLDIWTGWLPLDLITFIEKL